MEKLFLSSIVIIPKTLKDITLARAITLVRMAVRTELA